MPYKRISRSKYGFLVIIVSSIILGASIVSAFIFFIRDIKIAQDKLIIEHVQKLSEIFNRIHQQAHIVGFEHDHNYIDFLNVKSFTGSTVGSMHLKYPEKWEGPYLETNFEIQDKSYQVVKTRKGFWIVPGMGVRLSNGKIVGKDLKIEYDTDIESLVLNPHALAFRNQPLAAKINLNGTALADVAAPSEES